MVSSDDPIKKYDPLWGNWRVIDLLGAGSYGRVYRVARTDGGAYESAVKLITIPRSEEDIQEVRRMGMNQQSVYSYFEDAATRIIKEISIMHALKGEANIVSYEDHQIFHEPGSLQWDILIRMELLVPLDVYAESNPFAPDEIRRLGIEICTALEACSAYNIIHRDIKEGNIFLNARGTFKLGDFGIAREVAGAGSMSMSMRGTPAYIAPEVYNGQKYDVRADIYSLGILMYKLLNGGRYPFLPAAPSLISLDDTENAFSRRIRGETPPQPMHGDSALRAAVMRAISFDAHSRFQNAADFRNALLTPSSAVANKARPSAVPNYTAKKAVETIGYSAPQNHVNQRREKPSDGAARPASNLQKMPKSKKTSIGVAVGCVALVVLLMVLLLNNKVFLPAANITHGAASPVSTAEQAGTEEAAASILTAKQADPEAVVEWHDLALEKMVRMAIHRSTGDVQYKDLAAVTELYIRGNQATTDYNVYGSWTDSTELGEIYSLEDIQYFTGIENLYIENQGIEDLSPLTGLGQLQALSLANNHLKDAQIADLSGMNSLIYLNLNDNQLSDISALSALVNMEEIHLSGNLIKDISPLTGMTHLKELYLMSNSIQSVPSLEGLGNLETLKLRYNEINDISGIAGAVGLTYLDLSKNSIQDVTALAGLTNLQELNIDYNEISDISSFSGLSSLNWLEISSNNVQDIACLTGLPALKYLFMDHNPNFEKTAAALSDSGVSISW